ncbi:MAG: MaoC family dehydratase N-terminal domain-containing protein [Bifidobacteriaceae bacterium]|jgi:hypothetical protein|nr:MaoC family dehydratase N-terminal domain-containing protein [Bifidobacteriaceae bacterium]
MLGKTIADLETGDVFKPVRYRLTEESVTEYAHGQEDQAEWHYSAAPPYDRVVRPPTMIHADKMKILEANCDLERRVANVHTDDARIHYEYNAVQHSPAFVGEELVVTGGIVERYEKRGGDYLHYWLRVETADGRLVTTYDDLTLLSYKPKAGVK